MWAPDGKRLFSNPAGQFVAVSVNPKPSCTVGNPVVLPRGTFLNLGPLARRNHDIMRDGKRIVGVIASESSGASGETQDSRLTREQTQVVLNWTEELKARVPMK
jgi:hypothetical protein